MKVTGTFKLTVAVVFSLVIGFLIGIAVDFPKVNKEELSGAIARVKNFRNVKAGDEDIKLKNELIGDTVRLNSLKNYVNYYYLKSATLSSYIKMAVSESNEIDAFKTSNQELITSIDNYGKFLDKTRQDMLLVYNSLSKPENTQPGLLREMLEEVSNTIAQMKFRNNIVLEYIKSAESFLTNNQNTELEKAHDLLLLSQINTAIMNDDKNLQKWLSDKKMLSDVEKLSWWDSETLKGIVFLDTEKLNGIEITDAEKIGLILDKESLNRLMDNVTLNSLEKLGAGFTDVEKLGTGFTDSEKLGVGFFDFEKLALKLNSNETLGLIGDTENLSFVINDSEILGVLSFD